MNLRRMSLAAAALVVVAPAGAHAGPAKPKTVCNLLPDKSGDGGLRALSYDFVTVNSPALDILSADFATGAKNIVATIKVESLAVEQDPQAMTQARYAFSFKVKDVAYDFVLVRDWQGETTFSFSGGSATGTVNLSTNTITFTTSRRNVKELSKKGQKLTDLKAVTENESPIGSNADSATSPTLTYADRTPSCLKPA